MGAENLEPHYIALNPNGTVPCLQSDSPGQTRPLVDTREILEYIDTLNSGPGVPQLVPNPSAPNAARVAELIELAHGDDVSTNIVLVTPRNAEELEGRKSGGIAAFVSKRQEVIDRNMAQDPSNKVYTDRAASNRALDTLFKTTVAPGSGHEDLFASTRAAYEGYARGFDRLESLIVLPYAAGDDVSAADLHLVPWMAHAMMAAGLQDMADLDGFQAHFAKSVPGFTFGPKTRQWWNNIIQRDSVKQVFPKPR